MENWNDKWKSFLSDNSILNIAKDENLNNFSNYRNGGAEDEEYWEKIRTLYPVFFDIINLNNGAVCSNPTMVEHAFTSYYSLLNSAPSYFTWKVMEKGREVVREGLSNLINASKDEVAILRNATEALNNVIFGVNLNEGDEVVLSRQDYTKAVHSWKQRALRDKIKLVWVDITGKESNEELIQKFVCSFTEKTRIINLTHVINWNGQVLPVEPIIAAAKKSNIKILLDAAHSFGLLDLDVKKLDCDFMATALHKWMGGPIPSGLLFVKKDEISHTWPLASSVDPLSPNVRKFEELSIQLLPNILGLGHAIDFHMKIGRHNKEERLRHLRRFWTEKVRDVKGLKFNTPFNEDQCCVIVNISLANWKPSDLEAELFRRFKIHSITVNTKNLEGIRITPNIYTTKKELDVLVNALHELQNC
jgi:selenocysteine lyase/cysteine desulfurase